MGENNENNNARKIANCESDIWKRHTEKNRTYLKKLKNEYQDISS